MSNFMTDGFLSDEPSPYESQITDRYSVQLDFAKEVDRVAHEIIWSVEIDRNNLMCVPFEIKNFPELKCP